MKMTFGQVSKILDEQQAIKARSGLTAAERAKKTLSMKEKVNRYAQMGNVICYEELSFTWQDGMGILNYPDGKQLIGATIEDFISEIKSTYNIIPIWAK